MTYTKNVSPKVFGQGIDYEHGKRYILWGKSYESSDQVFIDSHNWAQYAEPFDGFLVLFEKIWMENEYQDRQSVRRNDDYECSLSDSAIESETSTDCRDRGRFSQRSQHP